MPTWHEMTPQERDAYRTALEVEAKTKHDAAVREEALEAAEMAADRRTYFDID